MTLSTLEGEISMAHEFHQYPAPTPGGPDPRTDPRFYQVVQGEECVAAYDSAHYPSLEAVLVDLLGRIVADDAPGIRSEDYAIWRAGRQVGAIRGRYAAPARGPNAEMGPGDESGPLRIFDSIRDDYRAA